MIPSRAFIWTALVTIVIAVGPACGPKQAEIPPLASGADRLLFDRGMAALEEGDWIRAREYFAEIRDNYPQSELKADARLGVGDTWLGQASTEGYVMAEAEFQDFLNLFPTNPRVDYAQFKLGMVNFARMRGPQRDQSWTRSAIREFEGLIQRYPNSQHIGEARGYLREARDRLSEAEYVVGHYYYRRKWWPGAIERFRLILDTDPAFSGRDRVYFHLGDALRQEGEPEEGLAFLERVVNEFPESEFASAAQEAASEALIELAAQAENPDPSQPGDENADQSPTESAPSESTATDPL